MHRDLECDIRYTLNAVANETNDVESCLEHTNIFLQIRQAIVQESGQKDERLARAFDERGIGFMMAGQYRLGEEAFGTSAEIYAEIFDEPNMAKEKRALALVTRGLAQWLQGDLEQASALLESGLRDREEMYGSMDTKSFRTGRFLHALGNVRYSQGLPEESEIYHWLALKQYQSTIRNLHHRTADVCHKVAQHCLRKGDHGQATILVNQALKVWSLNPDKYAPEISRTTHLKSKILSAAGQEHNALRLFEIAISMKQEITKQAVRSDETREEDFDNLVTFWSR